MREFQVVLFSPCSKQLKDITVLLFVYVWLGRNEMRGRGSFSQSWIFIIVLLRPPRHLSLNYCQRFHSQTTILLFLDSKWCNKISFCDYLVEGDSFNDIEGVFLSFDSKGVLFVPDPNQSQTRKGKSEGVHNKVLARCGRCNKFKQVLGQ